MQTKAHWENVYQNKPSKSVSWFQVHAETSLKLIRSTGIQLEASIIDVGGGASTLVDDLVKEGYTNLAVLDISSAALDVTKQRLGQSAESVNWMIGDITKVELPENHFDVWHDRAVFHFLTDALDRQSYVAQVMRAVRPDGHVIIATFAEDGPEKCSGLPVMRYSPETLQAEFGEAFHFISHNREAHLTPFGTEQQFVYCYFRKVND